MKIDCIGCLHGHFPLLSGGDVLILTGDYTARDKEYEYDDFFEWLSFQNYKVKLFIGGNHDGNLEKCIKERNFSLDEGMYLCDTGIEYKGIKFWGTPWTKTFPNMNPKCKAFTVDQEQHFDDYFDIIPNDVDILISHGPPYGILDKVEDRDLYLPNLEPENRFRNTGSTWMLRTICRVKPKYMIFSHIHENGGKEDVIKWTKEKSTTFINCSHMNEFYRATHKPMRIII